MLYHFIQGAVAQWHGARGEGVIGPTFKRRSLDNTTGCGVSGSGSSGSRIVSGDSVKEKTKCRHFDHRWIRRAWEKSCMG